MSVEADFDRADLATCTYCAKGWRRTGGVHPPTQRHGMIPDTMCDSIVPVYCGSVTAINAKPWMVYVDGHRLLDKRGFARRYASNVGACCAGMKASQDRP